MNTNFKIELINYGSTKYKKAVQLRYNLLRAPLGLHFSDDDLLQEKEEQTIAVFTKNQIIAVLQLRPLDKEYVKLRQMAVDIGFQNKGIGRELIQFSEKYAINNNFKHIVLHARKKAIGFYEKLGFNTVGKEFFELGLPHFKMLKRL